LKGGKMEQKKRFLNELDYAELKLILKNNKDVQKMVEEQYIEDTMIYIDEQLGIFDDSLENFEIGFYNKNWLKISNHLSFIYDFEKYVEWYGCSDETQGRLDNVLEITKQCFDDNDKIIEQAEILKKDLLENFENLTIIDERILWDVFCFMLDIDKFEDYYILSNDLSTIYIDISYTKTLK